MRKQSEPTVPLALYEDLLNRYDLLVQRITAIPATPVYPERSIPEGVLPWVTEEEEDLEDLHLSGRLTDDQYADMVFQAAHKQDLFVD